MSGPKDTSARFWGVACLLVLVLVPSAALAGFSGRAEPGFSLIQTSTDDHGEHLDTISQVLSQSYRLQLDQSLLPYLLLQGGGTFDDQHEWATTSPAAELARAESDAWVASAFVDLSLGSPLLGGLFGYRWRETSQSSSLVETRVGLTSHDLHFSGYWRPVGLPTLNLTLGRTYTTDEGRGVEDRVNDSLLFTARYHAIPELDLRYSGSLGRLDDRANAFEQQNVNHTASASYTDSWFDRRATVYLGYNITAQSTSLSSATGQGTVARQQLATTGLSLVEVFPAVPTLDTLTASPSLIDGDLDTAAGVELGFGPQLSGDNAYRDLGGQFTEPFPEVNRVYVVLDRTITATIASRYTWEAYKSDDNVNWTVVPLTVGPGAVPFDATHHRFEVPIERTRARYLKVITRPLESNVTLDPRYERVQVTELQFMLVLGVAEASEAAGSPIANVVNASFSVQLLESEHLNYDLSLLFTNVQDAGSRSSYYLTNGLSYRKALAQRLALSARVSRQDSDLGTSTGHQGAFLHGAGLAFDPLPTLSHRLVYSGEVRQAAVGTSFSNALSLNNRATLYKGVVVGATIGGDLGENELGRSRRGLNLLVTADLEPHPMLSLNGSFVHAYALLPTSALSGANSPELENGLTQQRVSGGVSFRPLTTLYLTGAVSWSRRTGAADRLLANYGLNFSPLPGGALQLDLAYAESDEVDVQGISRLFSSNVRWNIRTDILLVVGYTFSQARTEGRESVSNSIFSRLTVSI